MQKFQFNKPVTLESAAEICLTIYDDETNIRKFDGICM